jgi:hypothetical protein
MDYDIFTGEPINSKSEIKKQEIEKYKALREKEKEKKRIVRRQETERNKIIRKQTEVCLNYYEVIVRNYGRYRFYSLENAKIFIEEKCKNKKTEINFKPQSMMINSLSSNWHKDEFRRIFELISDDFEIPNDLVNKIYGLLYK